MVNRFFNKLLRNLLKNSFPLRFRLWCLRKIGVKVGDSVYLAEGLSIACDFGNEGNIIIGNRVAIGPNVILITDSYPTNSRLSNYRHMYSFLEQRGKIILKDNAWIGAGAIILPNVVVGECSIIAAGSVVTKDVPAKTVVAGVPAKVILELSID